MLNVMFYAAISQAPRRNGAYVRGSVCFSFCGDTRFGVKASLKDTFVE